ncbi:MAG: hydroxymethylglutaryl-CoA lyase, partial [Brevinematales bacterium]
MEVNEQKGSKVISIVEVSPRDGLQNEKELVPIELKEKFIKKLMESGVDEIEVGSFVSPKVVPQMKDTDELFLRLERDNVVVKFSALVPNLKGFERVMSLPPGKRPDKIAVFTAASETFNKRNIGMSVEESLRVFKEVVGEAKRNGFEVRAYVSTAFWCPFEGQIPPAKVVGI